MLMEPYKATLKEFVDVAGMHTKDGANLGFGGWAVAVQHCRSPHCMKNAFQRDGERS